MSEPQFCLKHARPKKPLFNQSVCPACLDEAAARSNARLSEAKGRSFELSRRTALQVAGIPGEWEGLLLGDPKTWPSCETDEHGQPVERRIAILWAVLETYRELLHAGEPNVVLSGAPRACEAVLSGFLNSRMRDSGATALYATWASVQLALATTQDLRNPTRTRLVAHFKAPEILSYADLVRALVAPTVLALDKLDVFNLDKRAELTLLSTVLNLRATAKKETLMAANLEASKFDTVFDAGLLSAMTRGTPVRPVAVTYGVA